MAETLKLTTKFSIPRKTIVVEKPQPSRQMDLSGESVGIHAPTSETAAERLVRAASNMSETTSTSTSANPRLGIDKYTPSVSQPFGSNKDEKKPKEKKEKVPKENKPKEPPKRRGRKPGPLDMNKWDKLKKKLDVRDEDLVEVNGNFLITAKLYDDLNRLVAWSEVEGDSVVYKWNS